MEPTLEKRSPAMAFGPLLGLLMGADPRQLTPTQLEGGEPSDKPPVMRIMIREWHKCLEQYMRKLEKVATLAAGDELTPQDVEALSRFAETELARHLAAEEQGFLPLMRLCLATTNGDDPIDLIVDGHKLLHRARERLLSAANAWKRFGDRPANRLHFARAALELQQAILEHLVSYLSLLYIADNCLSARNWEEGLKALGADGAGQLRETVRQYLGPRDGSL